MKNKQFIGDFLKRIKRPISLIPEKDYRLVTIKMNHNGVVLRGLKKGADIKSKMFEVKEGDFILSGIDARNGAFGIVPKELDGAIVTNDFWYFDIDESIINKKLFLELTSTTWFDEICNRGSDGTTQRIRLQKDKFFNQEINLPLPVEQKDTLSTILSIKLNQSFLNEQFIIQHELVKQLRQSILKEAISGFLTKDFRDKAQYLESSTDLLSSIDAEKQKLIEDKKIRKEKSPLPIREKDKPFELPKGWEWCRISQLGVITRGKSPKYDKNGKDRILNQKCIRWFNIETQHSKTVSHSWYQTLSDDAKTSINDILVNSTGEGTIGRSAVVEETSKGLLFDSHVLRIKTCVHPLYVTSVLNSDFGQDQINELKGAKSTKQTELGVTNLSNIIFPLAPSEEQFAITKKVNCLMAKCDELEDEIRRNELNSQLLMQSVIKAAF